MLIVLQQLTNRKCYVSVTAAVLSPLIVISGVPQGSVLGMLFFIIYMNDLCSKMTRSNFILFADDINIFRHITSIDDCFLLQIYTVCKIGVL
jgi:hypothetical protein